MTIESISRDITDRIRVEEHLRVSEARFRELAEVLRETVFEEDTEGRVTYGKSRRPRYLRPVPENTLSWRSRPVRGQD